MYDILIKNAIVYDGLGGEPFLSDIAVTDGKIARVAPAIAESAERVVDATGLSLTPGFIDSHSHSDNMQDEYPLMKEKLEQGITLDVTGQCGFSEAPRTLKDGTVLSGVAHYAMQGDGAKHGAYSLPLVGFNTLRTIVMGRENRAATKEEIASMQALLRTEMQNGAAGLSLGLIYVPGCYASTEEVIAVASVVKEFDGIIASHIRDEGDELIAAVEEFLTVIRETGCRAVFSHHKACGGKRNWGKVKTSLAMIDAANAQGCDIYLDVYPYVASHTTMQSTFVPPHLHPAGCKDVRDLLSDPEILAKAEAFFDERYEKDYTWIVVGKCPARPEYQGERIVDLARARGLSPMAFLYELMKECRGVTGCFFTMCEEDVETVLRHPRAMIGTDSSLGGDFVYYHPRVRGTFVRAIARYVRERKIVSLPEMIRKMTSLPAKVYRLPTKGVIREGMDADICIFDYERLTDRADFKAPTQNNIGLSYVLVNGEIVVEDGVANGTRPAGVILKT